MRKGIARGRILVLKKGRRNKRRKITGKLSNRNIHLWLAGILAIALVIVFVKINMKAVAEIPDRIARPGDMAYIPKGEFWMGNDRYPPRHQVYLDAFYIDRNEVTFEAYDKFCVATARRKVSDNGMGRGSNAVVGLNWDEANAYCGWAGKRLPTEAEWEKACRAGTDTDWFFGRDLRQIRRYAWAQPWGGNRVHEVGQKLPNGFGIFDMYGNAAEWCSDWYGPNFYAESAGNNPRGPLTGEAGNQRKVYRGFGWAIVEGELLWMQSSTRQAQLPIDQNRSLYFMHGCRCAKNP